MALAGLMGCSTQTETVSLQVDTTRSFSNGGTQEIPDRWWTVFGDQKLNILVDSALQANFNIQTSWQRLQEAQAIAKRTSASLFPGVDASLSGEAGQDPSTFRQDQRLRLGLRAQYEVDLWGNIQSRVEAERYRSRAAFTDYQTAALSLSAEIVHTWYQLIAAEKQMTLIQKQIQTNEKVLTLLKNRFGNGQIRSADILRQQQLLESTREQMHYAKTKIQVLKHQLSVLLGRPPQVDFQVMGNDLPDLPPLPETGIPTELIHRRPDIKSAFNRLQAADQEVAAAISNRYPRLSLNVTTSTAADNAEDLFNDWARSIAGNLLTPIFYAGQLNAEIERTLSMKRQRLFEYEQTLLNAFREVEDALIQVKNQKESIQNIQHQIALAQKTYRQLRIEYFNGMGGYLDVLTALDEQQQLRRDLLSARLTLMEYRIALYRSLAGGFETKRENHNETFMRKTDTKGTYIAMKVPWVFY